MSAAYIVAARRSIVAPRGGALSHLELHQIAAPVIRACLDDAGLAAETVDEVILSNALGAGGNPARLAALATGLPDRVAGLSIDRQCAGGLDAIALADALVRSGAADIVIAGGAESYSQRPERRRDGVAYDRPPFTPWPDRDPEMHVSADRLAQALDISRARQDSWAVRSHARARAARDRIAHELCPLPDVAALQDPFTRDLSLRLAARAPVICGALTHANTAPAADGAAFCVVVSERIRAQLGVEGVEILGGCSTGADPTCPGLAPVAAIAMLCERLALAPQTFDLVEIMEAYGVQAIACIEGAGLDPDRVNTSGGALARGHPIGASGAILAVRLFHDLMQRREGQGLAAIAAAGGIASALALGRRASGA